MYKYKKLQDAHLPRQHLSFMENFIITKYLKQEVDDDLSICVDERSSFGLSITEDIKIYHCHVIKRQMTVLPAIEKCPIVFYHGVAFTV